MLKPPTKKRQAEAVKLKAALREALTALGGVPGRLPVDAGAIFLATRGGSLLVHADSAFQADSPCWSLNSRFLTPELARAHFGPEDMRLNPYTGKWNFIGADDGEGVLDSFKREVAKITWIKTA